MGEMFSENGYREMIEECRNFKSRCIKPDEREVYLQLVYEKENIKFYGNPDFPYIVMWKVRLYI